MLSAVATRVRNNAANRKIKSRSKEAIVEWRHWRASESKSK